MQCVQLMYINGSKSKPNAFSCDIDFFSNEIYPLELTWRMSMVLLESPMCSWNMFLIPNSSPYRFLLPAIPLKYRLAFSVPTTTLSNC